MLAMTTTYDCPCQYRLIHSGWVVCSARSQILPNSEHINAVNRWQLIMNGLIIKFTTGAAELYYDGGKCWLADVCKRAPAPIARSAEQPNPMAGRF